MVLIQLLLPVKPDLAGERTPLSLTRTELMSRFSGLTAYSRAPAKGWWTGPDGHVERDDVVMIEIVTETFDRAWWREYGRRLAERFQQEEIHIRATPVELLGAQ